MAPGTSTFISNVLSNTIAPISPFAERPGTVETCCRCESGDGQPHVIHYSHQEADSRKFNTAFPAHRSINQAFVFAAASSLVMNCQSQQLGIRDLTMAQIRICPNQSVSFNKD